MSNTSKRSSAQTKKIIYATKINSALPNSTSIYDSDFTKNLILMENLVGTLVKYDSSARANPYIAKEWSVSDEGDKWSFHFHKSLKTENGKEITPQAYINGFYIVFKEYIKKSHPPIFKELIGYSEYASGAKKTIEGIKIITPSILEFHFRRKVSGVLEFLSMPYYGFHIAENFNKDGSWRDKRKIISSGSYRLESWNDSAIKLSARRDWVLNKEDIIPTVEFKNNYTKEELNNDLIISRSNQKSSDAEEDNFYEVFTVPTYIATVIISSKGIFSDPKLREKMRSKLLFTNKNLIIDFEASQKAHGFYHSKDNRYDIVQDVDISEISKKTTSIKVISPEFQDQKKLKYFKSLISNSLPQSIKIIWSSSEGSQRSKIEEDGTEEHNFDLRVTAVNSGSYPINWVIEMMFCSKMGVTFPDISGGICRLVKKYQNNRISEDEYLELFEKQIYNDASIIPILHMSLKWNFSNTIDPNSVDPTNSAIRFDLIREKK